MEQKKENAQCAGPSKSQHKKHHKRKIKTIFLPLFVLLLFIITGCGQQKETSKEQYKQTEQSSEGVQCEENSTEYTNSTTGQTNSMESAVSESDELQSTEQENIYDFTISFAGDINLDESWKTTQYLDSCENGIFDCISQELITAMQQADIMCLNNEFTYSTKGKPLNGKLYTFRADPSRVEVLQQMGVDVVTLANNHVYDYGKEALLDTFETLEQANISYFGAGHNLEEAMKPVYVTVDGKTVAFMAASRAEKYKMTPQATETEPGILRCYDTELFLETIRTARQNADFVIAVVHWGTEYSYELEAVQQTTGKEYIDAGADAVIGAHSHCLQGMEFYNGKPIIYSLGNYWFNGKTLDTMLLTLHFTGNDKTQNLQVSILPAVQSKCQTQYAESPEEQERIYSFLESISINVDIDEQGVVTETAQ